MSGSPASKARVVLEHIRGRSVPEARTILAFTQRAAAQDIEKVLRSAVANAETNPLLHWNGDDLVIKAAYADEGPTLKRWSRACARPGQPDPQAHLPRHDRAGSESEGRSQRRAPRAAAPTTTQAPAQTASSPAAETEREAEARRQVAHEEEGGSDLMGQKVHPGGLRVGVIHDWKSNWYAGRRRSRIHPRGRPDPRAHQRQARPCRAVGHPDPQGQAADHGRHLHGAPRDRDRQVGSRGRRAPEGAALDHGQERPHQHQRDQAPRAGREARRPVDRGAAAEPRQLPPGDEALARFGDALRRAGDQDPVRRPPRRRRDEPLGALHRGPDPAAHDPRRHRLRLRRGEDDLRPDRRQGLDQQGRDHAGGFEGVATGKDTRLGDQDQARRRRGGAAEGLGASREASRDAARTAKASGS